MLVDFYQLSVLPLERVLPRICERVIAEGGRLLVVAGDETAAERLDTLLWTYSPESFLPHGRAGADGDAEQPVLISTSPEPTNGARFVALTDGRWRDEALAFDRAFYFFDGETTADARTAWRALGRSEGIELRYWKQDERGRWLQGP